MYHYTDGGLRNVWLANGYEIKKTAYGEGVSFHNLDGLTRSICMTLTRKASPVTGAEKCRCGQTSWFGFCTPRKLKAMSPSPKLLNASRPSSVW